MNRRVVAAALIVVAGASGAGAVSTADVVGIAAGATVAGSGGTLKTVMKVMYKGVATWVPVGVASTSWTTWAARVLWWGGAAALAYLEYKEFWMGKDVYNGIIVADPVTGGIRVEGVLYPVMYTNVVGYGNYLPPGDQWVSYKWGAEGYNEALALRSQWLAIPPPNGALKRSINGSAAAEVNLPSAAAGRWKVLLAEQSMAPPYTAYWTGYYGFPYLAAEPLEHTYRPVTQDDLEDALQVGASVDPMEQGAEDIGSATMDELGRAVQDQPGSFASDSTWPQTEDELRQVAAGAPAVQDMQAAVDAMPESGRATEVGASIPGAVAIEGFEGSAAEQLKEAHKSALMDPNVLTGQQTATHQAVEQALGETLPGALAGDRALQEAEGNAAGLPISPTVDEEVEQVEKPETLAALLSWAKGQLDTLPWVGSVSGMGLSCTGTAIVTGTVRGTTVSMDFSKYETTFDLCGNILLTFTWFLWGRRLLGGA